MQLTKVVSNLGRQVGIHNGHIWISLCRCWRFSMWNKLWLMMVIDHPKQDVVKDRNIMVSICGYTKRGLQVCSEQTEIWTWLRSIYILLFRLYGYLPFQSEDKMSIQWNLANCFKLSASGHASLLFQWRVLTMFKR